MLKMKTPTVENAVDKYEEGRVSLGKAAGLTGLSVGDMLRPLRNTASTAILKSTIILKGWRI